MIERDIDLALRSIDESLDSLRSALNGSTSVEGIILLEVISNVANIQNKLRHLVTARETDKKDA